MNDLSYKIANEKVAKLPYFSTYQILPLILYNSSNTQGGNTQGGNMLILHVRTWILCYD